MAENKTNETNPTTSENIPQAVVNAIAYTPASIIETVRGDKFSADVKQGYTIEAITGSKFNIKRSVMEEMAESVTKYGKINNLIRNGWEADGKMSAGSGIALLGNKDGEVYNCTFFEGEMGKKFDEKKVQQRTLIQLNAEHLDAIFTTLRYDALAVQAKAEAMKLQRTTLDLG
jgi:hypothetical protein